MDSRRVVHAFSAMGLLNLSPGVLWSLRRVSVFLFAPALILLSGLALERVFSPHTPNWLIGTIALLYIPLSSLLSGLKRRWDQKREAVEMGARFLPEVKGRYWGNIDQLMLSLNTFSTGYMGEP